jgi:hypothetical protein
MFVYASCGEVSNFRFTQNNQEEKIMKSVIEVSLYQAQAAQIAIDDNRFFRGKLEQTDSNVWETEEYDENDEGEQEALDELLFEVQAMFRMAGITEYEIDDLED